MANENTCTIIAVANNKGGTGKTTTTATLGRIISSAGLRVLLVDLDPQSDLTKLFTESEPETTLNETFRTPAKPCTLHVADNLDIMPASREMVTLEQDLVSRTSREKILRKILYKTDVHRNYDFVLIDCSPSLGLLTVNALCACNLVLVPVSAKFMSLDGLKELEYKCSQLAEDEDLEVPDLGIDRIVITMFDRRVRSCAEIEEALRATFGEKVYRSVINLNSKVADAPRERQTVIDYAGNSAGAENYVSLAREVLQEFGFMK